MCTKKELKSQKEDDAMTTFTQYMENNRKKAYSVAEENTVYNEQGRPVISKDDEWAKESEWDDLFDKLKNKK